MEQACEGEQSAQTVDQARAAQRYGWGPGAAHFVGFHHSSFLSGAPVAAAGELQVNQGRVEVLSNASGHYKPLPRSLYYLLIELKQRRVDFSRAIVEVVASRFGAATCFAAPEFFHNAGSLQSLKPIARPKLELGAHRTAKRASLL